MPPKRLELGIQDDAADAYTGLRAAHQKTLVAPLDDMWVAFADEARAYALLARGETVGFCSVNEARELLSFYVQDHREDLAEPLFGYVIKHLEPVAACPSTVDPNFLWLSLDAGRGSVSKAVMYHHVLEPEGTPLANLRLATEADHPGATAFVEAATGFAKAFLENYLAERIEGGHLFLHEERGDILASGECRGDRRQPDFAHVGLIVGQSVRNKGIGSRLMHALVLECRRRNMKPLCSTEPENLAARRVIHRAGFRARHRVFRVALREPERDVQTMTAGS